MATHNRMNFSMTEACPAFNHVYLAANHLPGWEEPWNAASTIESVAVVGLAYWQHLSFAPRITPTLRLLSKQARVPFCKVPKMGQLLVYYVTCSPLLLTKSSAFYNNSKLQVYYRSAHPNFLASPGSLQSPSHSSSSGDSATC